MLAAGVLVCLALSGCKQTNSMEAVRKQVAEGKFEEAVEPLRELLKANPDDPEINFLYGQALSATQPNLAVWSLRKAMESPDWMIPAGTQLAYLSLVGNDFNEVFKITDQILKVDPDNLKVVAQMLSLHRSLARKEPRRPGVHKFRGAEDAEAKGGLP